MRPQLTKEQKSSKRKYFKFSQPIFSFIHVFTTKMPGSYAFIKESIGI